MQTPDIYDATGISPSEDGYFRYPSVFGEQVVFVSEDDLWTVPLTGGTARRLTAEKGQITSPAFSPNGKWLAYTSTEQGCPEVFTMAASGGPVQQLTVSGAMSAEVVDWSPDGETVLFRSNLREPFARKLAIYRVQRTGGEIEKSPLGDAHNLTFGPDGKGRALVRHTDDLAWWKQYRGGMAGQLWIDADGSGDWKHILPDITAGICRPMWIGERIYFISDRGGSANIHSCTLDGGDIKRHTDHDGHYVRFANHDDTTVVYSRAGDLYRLDTTDDSVHRIDVDYPSTRPALKPRFVDAAEYLDDYALHPQGHSLAIASRGKAFTLGNWEGAVRQSGRRHGVRYRLPRYLGDGERLLVVSDEDGEERFEIHDLEGDGSIEVVDTGDVDIGRAVDVKVSPTDDEVLVSNHRFELLHLDLQRGQCAVIDESPVEQIEGMAWAPDGRHVAYAVLQNRSTSQIKIADIDTGATRAVTCGEFCDIEPVFDPGGQYLYFLSYRQFQPVGDQMYFDLGFPRAVKPCVVSLHADADSFFVETPRPLDDSSDSDNDSSDGQDPLEIDFDGIADRVEVFPVEEDNFEDLWATEKRVYWTVFEPHKKMTIDMLPKGDLEYFDRSKKKVETFAEDICSFAGDRGRRTIATWNGDTLQVVSATGNGADGDGKKPGRHTGIVDLDRISLGIDQRAEWCQMLREAWRLVRDQFWRADMSGVDWDAVWDRYKALLPRLSARSEFSDLVWSMQGELGTSHAYEFGGDYASPPQYQPGLLGADLRWDPAWTLTEEPTRFDGAVRIEQILRGDPWDKDHRSPLLRPGLQIEEGDVILAINGRQIGEESSIGELLTDQAGREIELLVADGDGSRSPRTVSVEALTEEFPLRYREWVRLNRRTVREATDGRIGYVHIPDMGYDGYAEFHRQYQCEHRRDGLIVDVRFNGGGFVSQLILEKLARTPIGYNFDRHSKDHPTYTYPAHCVRGPVVALTGAEAGSDGDIFSHCFKQMELGPLVGERTWGGTIGIHPRHKLVDGTITTQPEFAFWFDGVGFGLENRGAEPDIEVGYPPETTPGAGDPQLRVAIDTAVEELETTEVLEPPPLDD